MQQGDRQERLIPHLPDTFGEGLRLDDLCDGKLLCALAISVDPSLASGRPGLAVPERIAFFQRFCRQLGVPNVQIVACPNVWPRPPRNPGALLACLGELGRILAERPEYDAPKMPAGVAVAATAASSTEQPVVDRAAVQQAQYEAAVAAMVPTRKDETAAEECRRLRGEADKLGEDPLAELVLAPTRDEEEAEDEPEPDEAEAAEPPGNAAVPERHTSQIYCPPEGYERPEFRADAMPMLHGHLYKLSPASFTRKRWDRRFFIIRDMHIHWWKSKADGATREAAAPDGGPLCKGTINLLSDPVELGFSSSSTTIFYLLPEAGKWGGEETTATKKRKRRVFAFDAKDSEYDREEWARAIHAHLEKVKHLKLPTLESFFQ